MCDGQEEAADWWVEAASSAGWVSREMLEYYDRAHASIRRNASHSLATYLTEK